MVLISTYRNSRIVSREFLRGPVMRMRAYADYWSQRPWMGMLHWTLPGDPRAWIVVISYVYVIHRWQHDHALSYDAYDKALIERWGGSLEEARKLSPQDQLRVRYFVDYEKLYAQYGPRDLLVQPEGDTLPGRDYYKKNGHDGAASAANDGH